MEKIKLKKTRHKTKFARNLKAGLTTFYLVV
jgi:hypothetical protein